MARLVSINVGGTREIGSILGKAVRSGIYKRPVDGLVNVGRVNLHRDQQADLAVHGGVNKAVYAYPSEHHPYWKERFPKLELIWWSSGRRGRHPK